MVFFPCALALRRRISNRTLHRRWLVRSRALTHNRHPCYSQLLCAGAVERHGMLVEYSWHVWGSASWTDVLSFN